MSTAIAATNHQFKLASRPTGAAKRENFSYGEEPVAQPADGGVLVKTLMLSLDPAMRGWLNEGKSYIPPVELGAVMRAGGIGRVVASRNPAFAVGDMVSGTPGVQEYWRVGAEGAKRERNRLSIGEHQRRQPVTALQLIRSVRAALGLDRDAHVLKHDDVASNRA